MKITLSVLTGLAGITALVIGISLGLAMATMRNISDFDSIADRSTALPTEVYDIHGTLITQFFSDEKREIVSLDEMPKHLIYALIAREDNNFFEHNGFSLRGTMRAAVNVLIGSYFSGGSTITQQLAGHIFADRSEISVTRKLRELWWAFQLERHWTKNEILEQYLNRMYFGANTYGAAAASKFYFNKNVQDITVAESAILVIQLANPSLYNPFRRPNAARKIQETVLDKMVELGYITREEADRSFTEYWANFDFSRAASSTAFFNREDRAPYFSEHVRNQLQNEILLGTSDIYRDGYRVYTTLDLNAQESAQRHLSQGIHNSNRIFSRGQEAQQAYVDSRFVPTIDMLSLAFNIPDIHVADARQLQQAKDVFLNDITPVLDMLGLQFAENEQQPVRMTARAAHEALLEMEDKTTVQGALIALDPENGHIKAMIGGSQFEGRNQLNRATQGRLQPGSSFKPLYYSAAIEDEVITTATRIYDSPVVFWNDDGTPYTPMNYNGIWAGPVLARRALYRSLNVPAIKVLNRVGFTSAIETASRLLDIPPEERSARGFVRRYPLGLGIVSVSPLEMAQAYAVFANRGQKVDPVSIRFIENRDGQVIAEPERDLRNIQQSRSQDENQILSPQTAYIMTSILRSGVTQVGGTLHYAATNYFDEDLDDMQICGKTGTTQNWADAWTVGFSPYLVTAVWIGFDRPGNSLGRSQNGAVTAAPIWAQFMADYHEGLEARDFPRPARGITEVEISARSGLLVPENFTGPTLREIFISGTEPTEFDTTAQQEAEQNERLLGRLSNQLNSGGLDVGSPLRDIQTVNRTISLDSASLGINLSLDTSIDLEDEETEINLLDDMPENSIQAADSPYEVDSTDLDEDGFVIPPEPDYSNPLLD